MMAQVTDRHFGSQCRLIVLGSELPAVATAHTASDTTADGLLAALTRKQTLWLVGADEFGTGGRAR